jgi:transposase
MKILALDLGKNKSVFVDYVTGNGTRGFGKIDTSAPELQKLLERVRPDRLVIETCPAAGWVCDLAQQCKIPIQVANGNDERWRWKTVKEKSDRKDALKLAVMSEMESLPTVHVPKPAVRQWRSLIEYRDALVGRQTAIKNSIRSIYERQGLRLPASQRAWTQAGVQELEKEALARGEKDIWLLQVELELRQLETVGRQIDRAQEQLGRIADLNPAVKRLREAPGVGPRVSEAVVAILDDPHRFKNGRQVGCYAGLTPRRWQSGESDRQGHISRAGPPLLRKLLVQAAWTGVRNKTWMLEVYQQVCRGSDKRKKIAIVAVARRLLVRLWAMLRDGTRWKERTDATMTAACAAGG